jgi:phosphatidate cytidylyltransferase
MGALLVALAVGVLVLDGWLAPWYPCLFVVMMGLAVAACHEFLLLLGDARPPAWLCFVAVAALVAANWAAPILRETQHIDTDPWHWVLGTFIAVVVSSFLWEMATFREPGRSVPHVARTVLIAAYLGLLPSFLAQLRWLPGDGSRGTLALSLVIFVPKFGDVGAYMTGRYLGRHRMTPVLSPKKTWEGLAGGLAVSIVTAVAINRLGPLAVLRGGDLAAVGFGLTVGVAGVLGDLAESLIKRDCGHKDASHVVPGFGGVLDVIDSLLFAAPVAYCWLAFRET